MLISDQPMSLLETDLHEEALQSSEADEQDESSHEEEAHAENQLGVETKEHNGPPTKPATQGASGVT